MPDTVPNRFFISFVPLLLLQSVSDLRRIFLEHLRAALPVSLRANISETGSVLLINERQVEKEESRDEREFTWCCSFLWGFGAERSEGERGEPQRSTAPAKAGCRSTKIVSACNFNRIQRCVPQANGDSNRASQTPSDCCSARFFASSARVEAFCLKI